MIARRFGLAAAAAVLTLALASIAAAADTATLYNDYAHDRALSCGYSEPELRAVLTDATLGQYGDPYTITGLKLAVRKQLAGSCGSTPSNAGADDGGSWNDSWVLLVGAGVLLVALAAGGWFARRALVPRQ